MWPVRAHCASRQAAAAACRGGPAAQHQSGRSEEGPSMDIEKLAKRYRVTDGKGFRLADHDPADTGGLDLDKKEARGLLQEGIERPAVLRGQRFAHDPGGVLADFHALDAAGEERAPHAAHAGAAPEREGQFSLKAP